MWDLPTVLQTGLTDYLNNVALADDGRTLAIGSGSVVELWDIADGRRPARLGSALSAGVGGVNGVAFGPDGRTLVGGGDRAVRLWDTTHPTHRPRWERRFPSPEPSTGSRSARTGARWPPADPTGRSPTSPAPTP